MTISNTPPLIDLNAVTKAYKTDAGLFMALKGVDLHINAGEFVAIVGKSGSGKTTLINMITGLDRPTDGEILVGGETVEKLGENQLAIWRGRTIGVVFQFFQLLPTLTALENVMLPMDFCATPAFSERRDRALELLAPDGDRRPGQQTPRQTLWRTAAARRHCPRPRHRSAHPRRR